MLITKRILKKWMLEMIKLSIIIPVLNEEQNLQILLPYLQKHTTTSTEIIVVDGGSSDESINVIKRFNTRLITSNVGRAAQMNAGAREAKGNRLYFLHADCKPPYNFENLILSSEFQAGSFRMKFENGHWMLMFCAWFTRFNWQICRGGDRSLFVDKLIFEKGFFISIFSIGVLINNFTLFTNDKIFTPYNLLFSTNENNNSLCISKFTTFNLSLYSQIFSKDTISL